MHQIEKAWAVSGRRLMKMFRAAAAAFGLALASVPGPSLAGEWSSATSQSVDWGGSACQAVPAETQSLCQGLEARRCSLAASDHFWTCMGFVSGDCSVISDYRNQILCRAITGRQCSYASELADQLLCRGVVQSDCRGLDERAFAWCSVMVSARAGRPA